MIRYQRWLGSYWVAKQDIQGGFPFLSKVHAMSMVANLYALPLVDERSTPSSS
jgi:hypothetical protein